MSPELTTPSPPASVLVVDDDEQIVALFGQVLRNAFFDVTTASDVGSAYAALGKKRFDLAVLDLNMPDGSGLEIVDAIFRTAPETAIVLITAVGDRHTATVARARGVDTYLVKPVLPHQLLITVDDVMRRRSAGTSKTATRQDRDAFERLVKISILRDAETGNHSGRMSQLCEDLALELGLGAEHAAMIRRASRLHDIGKIAVPDEILHKAGPIDAAERRQIERHPTIGWTLLSGSEDPLLDLAATIALCHHEQWNGTGYPHGLEGHEIPLEARIAAVCDVYDALTSDRPYRDRLSCDEALGIIERGSGEAFDPVVAEAFLRSNGPCDVNADHCGSTERREPPSAS